MPRRPRRRRLFLESLESRRLLAVCAVSVDDGGLSLTGDDSPNHVIIEQGATADEFVLSIPASVGGESVTIGEDISLTDYNSFAPFGGSVGGEGTRYQQVYSAAEFPTPLSISAAKFFIVPNGGGIQGTVKPVSFHFEFSITSKAVDGLWYHRRYHHRLWRRR